MESVPLIPKAEVLPNSDASPLIRELFQQEFQITVPSKKLSENIVKSLQYEKPSITGEKESFKSVEFLENLTKRKDNLIDFAETVLEAYTRHEENLKAIRDAEENIFETQTWYLKRDSILLERSEIHDLFKLKRQPLFKPLDVNHLKEFRLLQGDAGLPPKFEAKSDFRVNNFTKWRKRLESLSQDSLIWGFLNRVPPPPCDGSVIKKEEEVLPIKPKRIPRLKEKKSKLNLGAVEIFRAEPKFVFFTNYKPGEVYYEEIELKNVYSKGMRFQVKPMCPEGPFRVTFYDIDSKIFPGLSVILTIEFAPKTLDNVSEDISIAIEDGTQLTIPLMAYLEPPILKTHLDIDEFTNKNSERIASSYIECGECFAGDTKVTKLRFHGVRGSGEFFIMSSENWDRSNVNSVTVDNLLEIPPFRVYPVYFKIDKNEVIDLFVEFSPKTFGTHVENIVIACDNGEVRRLDLIADSVGWHSYFFSFQDFLFKELPVDKDDDLKVKYYLDFNESKPSGKLEKTFSVYNNSHMSFEFQWKIRDANISTGQDKYLKLSKQNVKIDPESGTFKPKSAWEFLVTITFDNAEIGEYRTVLSFYVLNLPYQCIEEDNTIIQPTGLVRNLYSQSLCGEEDYIAPSPELLSLQGTYESLQESIKSYVECQNKAQALSKFDFCRTFCMPNPNLCAKPLKKSKTYVNIGENIDDEGLTCICRGRPAEPESSPESCTWNGDKINEASILKNEVIWDFVDILVDEIELWAEVSPTKVTLLPSVIEFSTPLKINDPPLFKQVKITNHNQFPVTCHWTKLSCSSKPGHNCNGEKPSLSLLFNHQVRSDSSENTKETGCDSAYREKCGCGKTGEKILQISIPEEMSDGNCDGSELCNIFVEPGDEFIVSPLSDYICNVGLSLCRPEIISEELTLLVNEGDLTLTLNIMGKGVMKYFSTFPEILDFGALKQGTRCMEEYKIINESSSSLFWRINQYNFDFESEQFYNSVEIGERGSIKRYKGILTDKDNMAVEPFFMDARKPGIKCSLLEVQMANSPSDALNSGYIMILGNVKLPVLSLQAARFENAILAPVRMMYVGETISTQVTLRNIGNVETSFIWGHPFGCHCRKIKVEILPKKGKIDKMKKLILSISLTPLEEGIINHCYIPCFFCRTVEPLILSIVGLTESLNVTFEIIDYPYQKHADVKNFLRSPFYHTVLRVAWPFKNYDPNVGRRYIHEEDILNMNCHCLEVEEEGNRAFDGQPLPESEPSFSEENLPWSGSTSKNSKSLSSKISRIPEKDSKRSNSSEVLNGDRKISDMISPVYPSRGSSIEALQFVKFELEFLNVPCQTPIQRQFVIRNETPVGTSFQLKVLTYGVSDENRGKRIEAIRNRVFDYSTDDFKNKMRKEQPLVLVVEPTRGELLGYDTVLINVFAYGNTWGEYRDYIICEVKGIQAFYLKAFIQIAGHPIDFPMFSDQVSYKPTLRFEPTSHISEPTVKRIRVRNRSAIPLTMSWIIFLTCPLEKDEEQEDSFNLGIDSNANLDSNHSEESSKSAKVYLPKNTSGSILTFRNKLEMLDYSQNSGAFESFRKSESISGKNVNQDSREGEKSSQSFNVPSLVEEDKSDSFQQLPFLGKIDLHTFQIDPKEVTFEAFEEKKLTITFDPRVHKPKTLSSQEFKGVLTGWVKLRPEDEKLPGVYYRPCGINFVSELLDLNAITETSLVSFEMLKGDLKFIVDANAVVKSPSKKLELSRKFLIKNNSGKSVSLKIEVTPEVIFYIKKINTIDKVYEKYNPEKHRVKVDPGKLFEIELECSVSYKHVSYAFEKLLWSRKKEENTSDETKTPSKSKSGTENDEDQLEKAQMRNNQGKQPCSQYLNHFTPVNHENSNLEVKDSFHINMNRMSPKSGSTCSDSFENNYLLEVGGECFDLPFLDEISEKQKPVQHIWITKEEINFVQTGQITQTFEVQLHLSFPIINISPKHVHFGNVFIGETAIRYCSFINLRGFPTDYIIKQRCKVSDFVVKPITGSLSPTNYKSNTGKVITIEFKPSQPGYCREIYLVYCNPDFEFDCFELFVTGIGTWNEKYRFPKVETCTKLEDKYAI